MINRAYVLLQWVIILLARSGGLSEKAGTFWLAPPTFSSRLESVRKKQWW